jgi:hypothetical protein
MTEFSVNLDTLADTATAISAVMAELESNPIKRIDCPSSAFGHQPLANAVRDFCDRWQIGVEALVKDGAELADRLAQSVNTYIQAENTAIEGFVAAGEALGAIGNPPAPGLEPT